MEPRSGITAELEEQHLLTIDKLSERIAYQDMQIVGMNQVISAQNTKIAELSEQVAILNKENEVAWGRVAELETEIALCPLCDKPSDNPTGAWSRDDRRKIAMMCE